MPSPGIAFMPFMFLVAVGLGMGIYYLFADAPNANNAHTNRQGNRRRNSSSRHNSWSNPLRDKIEKRTALENQCSICLDSLSMDVLEFLPCNHTFHKNCLAEWKLKGIPEARDTCPNCRKLF